MNTHKKRFDFAPYFFILPAAIMLIGITFYPFLSSFILSFFDYSFLKEGMNFIGIKNYTDILLDGKFTGSIAFTLKWVFLNLILITFLGFFTSLLIQQKFIGRNALKAIMLIPWILPQVVTGYIWSMMLSQDMGIINRILYIIGILPADFSWFSSEHYATLAVVLANSWKAFPFVALMLYSKMQAIPTSQIEAARIDGAGALGIFRYITIPFVLPVYLTCMLLSFIWTFNAFDIIRVMTNGEPVGSTTTLSMLVQKEAFSYLEISKACTMAVMMFIIISCTVGTLILLRKIVRQVINQ